MICALIMCRDGVLPAGAADVFVAAGRRGVVVGVAAAAAAAQLPGPGIVDAVESSHLPFRVLARHLGQLSHINQCDVLVLPASPDGRDLAPHLALSLQRPLLAGATRIRGDRIRGDRVTTVRSDGLLDFEHRLAGPCIVTLIPGLSGTFVSDVPVEVRLVELANVASNAVIGSVSTESLLPADPTTMDLAEARCIVAGGQGLASKLAFDQLGRIGAAIGGSLGGTRVASDAGWIPFERQIGTTGVAVAPRVYLAFAISGATQHTSGLGSPDHIISVNTDPSCPMMAMSQVAIVSDAVAVLGALEAKLAARTDGDSDTHVEVANCEVADV